MPPTALVLLAKGAEEMETVIVVDVLRRGGVTVTLAGLAGAGAVTCSREVVINPDCDLATAINGGAVYDAVVLPGGGGGAAALASSSEVGLLLQKQEKEGRIIAAVCAAPTALLAHNIGKGKRVTSYPVFKDKLQNDYNYVEEDVVVDGELVTSRGPGTCFKFGLALVTKLVNSEKAEEIGKAMLV